MILLIAVCALVAFCLFTAKHTGRRHEALSADSTHSESATESRGLRFDSFIGENTASSSTSKSSAAVNSTNTTAGFGSAKKGDMGNSTSNGKNSSGNINHNSGANSTASVPKGLSTSKVKDLLTKSANYLKEKTSRFRNNSNHKRSKGSHAGTAYEIVKSPFSITGEDDEEDEEAGGGGEGEGYYDDYDEFHNDDGDRDRDGSEDADVVEVSFAPEQGGAEARSGGNNNNNNINREDDDFESSTNDAVDYRV